MAAKKKSDPQRTKMFHEDEFGIPHFHQFDDDPYESMLKNKVIDHLPDYVTDAAIHVHDHLEICRRIAVSIYGRAWTTHLMPIFDRFRVDLEKRREQASFGAPDIPFDDRPVGSD